MGGFPTFGVLALGILVFGISPTFRILAFGTPAFGLLFEFMTPLGQTRLRLHPRVFLDTKLHEETGLQRKDCRL